MSGRDVHRPQSGLGGRFRGGDRRALLELYDQMGSFVYGMALRITASPPVAAGITEDVFLQIWNHPEELDGHGSTIRTRLAVLTHGRAVERVRRDRAAEADGAEGTAPHRGEPVGFSAAQELAEALATAGRVQGALAELSPEQQLALEVTHFGGNTYQAAAAILGTTGAVVAAQVGEALHHVAAALKPCATGRPGIGDLDGTETPGKGQGVEGVDPDAAR
jgi:RNA polymerase sigma-70 factor (ECF subfamily)